MTLRIFRAGGKKVETIAKVMHVMVHSVATGYDGQDIEVKLLNTELVFEERNIHIGMWDFYSLEA